MSTDRFDLAPEQLESALKNLSRPTELGKSTMTRMPRVAGLISQLGLEDNAMSRGLALSMLIEGTIEAALQEPNARDSLEMTILHLLYIRKLDREKISTLVGMSPRSISRYRSQAIESLARRLLMELMRGSG